MKTIKHVTELSLLRKEQLVVLMVSSPRCQWCKVFYPIYEQLEEDMKETPYTFTQVSSRMLPGLQMDFNSYFESHFGHRVEGVPSMYVVDYRVTKIPISVMWDKVERSFDPPAIKTYLEEYLSSRPFPDLPEKLQL